MNTQIKLNFFLVICAAIFLLISRFYKITEIPTAFVHDELIYVMQAKALAFTGKDMTGRWSPQSLTPFNGSFAELPASIMSWGVNVSSNQILNGRITHLLFGIALPLILSWFIYGIWQNKHISILTFVVAVVNPWLWQFSRMTFDSLFSLFFYLLAGAIILNVKKWWQMLAIPLLFVGFYQYQGMKLLLVVWFALILSYSLLKSNWLAGKQLSFAFPRHRLFPSLIIFGFTVLLFSYYFFFALPNQNANVRKSQIVFFEREFTTTTVNTDRRLSLQNPLLPLVINKYSVMANRVIKNGFDVLSPGFMFFAADEAANRFAVTKHGYFYLIDFVLVLVGICLLLSDTKNIRKNIYYLFIVICSTIPAIVSTSQSFTFRASLFYLLLLPIIAYSLEKIIQTKSKPLISIVVFLYVLSVAHFGYQYFYQYPVYAADGQFFSERVIANYLKRVDPNTQVIIYSPEESMFDSYLFYNNLYTKENASSIAETMNSGAYTVGNVQVTNRCVDLQTFDPKKITITLGDPDLCEGSDDHSVQQASTSAQLHPLRVPAIDDDRFLYLIYNDTVCSNQAVPPFLPVHNHNSFAVERLSLQDLCGEWFSREPSQSPN